jgi:hypothetical protein
MIEDIVNLMRDYGDRIIKRKIFEYMRYETEGEMRRWERKLFHGYLAYQTISALKFYKHLDRARLFARISGSDVIDYSKMYPRKYYGWIRIVHAVLSGVGLVKSYFEEVMSPRRPGAKVMIEATALSLAALPYFRENVVRRDADVDKALRDLARLYCIYNKDMLEIPTYLEGRFEVFDTILADHLFNAAKGLVNVNDLELDTPLKHIYLLATGDLLNYWHKNLTLMKISLSEYALTELHMEKTLPLDYYPYRGQLPVQ